MSRYSVHPMEKKFIKDTTGVDLDAPPPDLVKKFNTQESDEIESLRKEVEKYHKAQQDFYIPNAALRAQVAELEKERDEWKESAINGGNAGYLREKVAELEKDLDTERRLSFRTQVGELEEAIETCKVTEQMYKKSKEYAFGDLRKAQARITELERKLEQHEVDIDDALCEQLTHLVKARDEAKEKVAEWQQKAQEVAQESYYANHYRVANDNLVEQLTAAQARIAELEKDLAQKGAQIHSEVLQNDLKIMAQQQARIIELREAFDLIYSWANNWDSEFMDDPDWRNVDFPKVQDIVTRPDDTSALNEYRNKVIDECIDMLENGNQSIASLKR